MTDLFCFLTSKQTNLRDSVTTHLHALLNTRRGSLHHMPEYGMPEYDAKQDFSLAKANFMTALKDVLERYEPRISSLCVKEVGSERMDCVLQVQLIATLAEKPFSLAALLLSGGDILVVGSDEG